MSAAHSYKHMNTKAQSFTQKHKETTKTVDPGHWHAALFPPYLDYIFMYFYFLGSPTGDSQNGTSGVNFTEHDFLSDRGCSQPIFHGWSKQESSEQGNGDRCSLEDSRIDRKTKKQNRKHNRQWFTFILRCKPKTFTMNPTQWFYGSSSLY